MVLKVGVFLQFFQEGKEGLGQTFYSQLHWKCLFIFKSTARSYNKVELIVICIEFWDYNALANC